MGVEENVLTSSECLVKELAANDRELESFVESESDVGSEKKSSRHSHKGTVLNKNVKSSEISSLQGDGDMHKKSFFFFHLKHHLYPPVIQICNMKLYQRIVRMLLLMQIFSVNVKKH
jgi:hypothetical protein